MQTEKVKGNDIFTDTQKSSKSNAYDVKNQFKSLLKASCFEIETRSKSNILASRNNNSFNSFEYKDKELNLPEKKRSVVKREDKEDKVIRQEKVNSIRQDNDVPSKEDVVVSEDKAVSDKEVEKVDSASVKQDENTAKTSDNKEDDVSEEVVEEMAVFAFAPVITKEKIEDGEFKVDLTSAFSEKEDEEISDITSFFPENDDAMFATEKNLPLFDSKEGKNGKMVLDQTSKDGFTIENLESDAENFTHLFNGLVKNNKASSVGKNEAGNKAVFEDSLEGTLDAEVLKDMEYSFDKETKGSSGKNFVANNSAKVKEQVEYLSKFLENGENISVAVGKELQKQKNHESSLSSLHMPLIAENAEGNTEVVLNQNQAVMGVAKSSLKETESDLLPENKGEAAFENKSSSSIFGYVETKPVADEANVFLKAVKGEASKIEGIDFASINKVRFTDVEKNTSVKEIGGKFEVKAEEIADQIKVKFAGLKQGEDKFLVKLKPRELGDIEIELKVTKDGKVSAVINSNKQETNQILQREVQTLQKMFTDNGYKADVSSFSFNFRGSNSNGGENNGQNNNPHNTNNQLAENNENFVREGNEENYQRRGILA